MVGIKVVNSKGVPFNVRLEESRRGKPIVVFYDARKPQSEFTGEFGQNVASYDVDTIQEHTGGLWLNAGVDAWQVSAANIEDIKKNLLA